MPSHTSDAAFYDMIFGLLEQQRSADGVPIRFERRRNERHAYECVQMLAPFQGEHLPPATSFRPVLCHDLSPSGFSFYCTQPPACSRLVIGLGVTPFTFVIAEVRYMREVTVNDEPQYLVGCQMIERIT